jgi:hypothetical protein
MEARRRGTMTALWSAIRMEVQGDAHNRHTTVPHGLLDRLFAIDDH